MQNQKEILNIDLRSGRGRGTVRVITLKDHQFYVALMPSLNLTGYGDTEKEAIDMLFEDVVMDFFQNLFKLPEAEISVELGKYGFKKSGFFKKRFTGTAPFVATSEILSSYNLPPETKVREQYLQVA